MPNVIIENGALNIRVGYENSQVPNLSYLNKIVFMPNRSFYDFSNKHICGDDVDLLEGAYNIKSPVVNGRIENWEAMNVIWKELMTQIGLTDLSAKEESLASHVSSDIYFITSVNYTPTCHQKILNFFFDNYGITKIGFGLDAINALQSVGQKSGIVVDSGDSITKIVPILDGYVDPRMIWQSNVAGKTFSDKIKKNLVTELGEPILTQRAVDFLKEKYFFHKLESDTSPTLAPENVTLPDGSVVVMGAERTEFPDIIFRETSSEGVGLIQGYFETLNGLDRESKQLMSKNTLLVGGNTKTKDFDAKFKEQAQKVSKYSSITIQKSAEPLLASFQGSSANVFMLNEAVQSITRTEFQEVGESIIFRKKIPLLF